MHSISVRSGLDSDCSTLILFFSLLQASAVGQVASHWRSSWSTTHHPPTTNVLILESSRKQSSFCRAHEITAHPTLSLSGCAINHNTLQYLQGFLFFGCGAGSRAGTKWKGGGSIPGSCCKHRHRWIPESVWCRSTSGRDVNGWACFSKSPLSAQLEQKSTSPHRHLHFWG